MANGEEEEEECSTSIDIAPAPHCEGKVQVLSLRYTGGDCSQTMTSQSAGKVGCVDPGTPSLNPVRIIVSDGASAPLATTAYTDVTGVIAGDIIQVVASAAGHNDLKSVTGYWIKDAVTGEILQDGFFHTSCSQPLNLGDQIGALQVFALDTTHGGTAALGAEVEYSYKVTNPNDDDAEYVVVEDDKLGIIASDEIIPAGESVTFMTTAFIEEATTNVATVNGEVGGVMCEEAASEVTITLTDPPGSPTICTEKISTTSNG